MTQHNLSTSNSKKGIRLLLKCIALILFFVLCFILILPQNSTTYNAAAIDKINRLKSINEPKIVIVGDSSNAFGIKSELIEQAFGMPVVNMGLHAALGVQFSLNMAKKNVTEGDLYILSINCLCEETKIDTDTSNNGLVLLTTMENHIDLWRCASLGDIPSLIKGFPSYLRKCVTNYAKGHESATSISQVYCREAFNEYGDIGVVLEKNEITQEIEINKETARFDYTVLDKINQFNDYITSRGATLVLTFSAAVKEYKTESDIINFQNTLQEYLNCPVISNFAETYYDRAYIYDFEAHLTTQGANIRTKQLIADIQKWQESGEEADPESDLCADIYADNYLSSVTDIDEYLDMLVQAKDRYTVFISAKGDASKYLSNSASEKLKTLGLATNLQSISGVNYAAVVDCGAVAFEESAVGKVETGADGLDDGNLSYYISSCTSDNESYSVIYVNGVHCSMDNVGLNLVVYCNETHRIIDEVAFNTELSECNAIR